MPERELVLECMGRTAQNCLLANGIQPSAPTFLTGLSNTSRVCTPLGASRTAFSLYEYHSAETASRPSPSGACGGLDPVPATWSSIQSRRRCGKLCSASSYNLMDGNRGHVTVRSTVKSFGSRLPRCIADAFADKCQPALPAELRTMLQPLLGQIRDLTKSIKSYDASVEEIATKKYPEAGILRTVPGVGPIASLAFVLTIGNKDRFGTSRDVGAYLGLRPKRSQSGACDPHAFGNCTWPTSEI